MNDLRVRPAAEADLASLVRLRDDAARWMLARGITGQWRPGELAQGHFRQVMEQGEVWLAEVGGRIAGAWELWWEDEAAWGPQPPVAGYVHRLMVDRRTAAPGTGLQLLRAAERRVAAVGRMCVRLDCLAGNEQLNAYYRHAVTASWATRRASRSRAGRPSPSRCWRRSFAEREARPPETFTFTRQGRGVAPSLLILLHRTLYVAVMSL